MNTPHPWFLSPKTGCFKQRDCVVLPQQLAHQLFGHLPLVIYLSVVHATITCAHLECHYIHQCALCLSSVPPTYTTMPCVYLICPYIYHFAMCVSCVPLHIPL